MTPDDPTPVTTPAREDMATLRARARAFREYQALCEGAGIDPWNQGLGYGAFSDLLDLYEKALVSEKQKAKIRRELETQR